MKLILEEHLLHMGDIRGGVTLSEAKVLAGMVVKEQLKSCLEIGVAKGASALTLAQAVSEIGGSLEGIDPWQLEQHDSAALRLLERYGLQSAFVLHPWPTHLVAPKLLEAGRVFDLVFVDGMHNFEFKCLDCFYSDRLLRVGGLLALHDATYQSTKKVARLLLTTGRFTLVNTPELHLPLTMRIARLCSALLKRRSSAWFWPNGSANLLILRKVSKEEVAWNYFQDF